MKLGVTSLALVCGASCFAQIPDVQFKADFGPTYRSEAKGGSAIRWYDPFGHHSVIALQFALEPGFRAYVAQKIQRIANDGDNSQVDESYVEDTGVWRAGKQYLPFGNQVILRESVTAIRSDTELFLRVLPMSVAACDGGSRRQRGFIGRIGTDVGFSFAFGRHFGISGTSLTQIRLPEESPGVGTGFRQVLGMDFKRQQGKILFLGDFALFSSAEQDIEDLQALDLSATYQPAVGRSLTFGYSTGSVPGIQSFRVQGSFLLGDNIWLEPWVRTRDGSVHDAGVTARVRL